MQENIVKKIDDSYRILIPYEIREKLGLYKQQEVEISLNKNKQIVIKPRSIKIEEPKTEPIKDDLLNDKPIVIPNKEERISSKILDKSKPKSELCSKCGTPLEEGNRLRLNGRKICKSCTENLKKELLYNIYIKNQEKSSRTNQNDLD